MTDSLVKILALDKPYIRLSEAAELACVSAAQFREHAPRHGIVRRKFMGRWHYRRADVLAVMDNLWRQSESESEPEAFSGKSTGETQTDGSVASRLAELERSRAPRSRSSGPRKNSSGGGSVAQLPASRRSQNGPGNT